MNSYYTSTWIIVTSIQNVARSFSLSKKKERKRENLTWSVHMRLLTDGIPNDAIEVLILERDWRRGKANVFLSSKSN